MLPHPAIASAQATATLRVMDPFGTMGWTLRASDGRVIQLMDRRFGARGA